MPFRALQEQGVHGLWATALVYAAVGAAVLARDPAVVRRLACTPSLWPLLLASGITNACFNWAVTIGEVLETRFFFVEARFRVQRGIAMKAGGGDLLACGIRQ